MTKQDRFIIKVPVQDVSKDLILKQHVGSGTYDGHEIELQVALPSYSPMVRIGAMTFYIDINDIVKAVAAEAIAEKQT
jgi:hypothetical protein